MTPRIKNVLAVIGGWLGGSIINGGLVYIGGILFPIDGVDTDDMEAMAAIMPELDFKYFIFPFLAHALGTLVGAIIAYRIAASHKINMALIVGSIFLVGGVVVNYLITGPMWFTALDILVAYLPMAWLGTKLAGGQAV